MIRKVLFGRQNMTEINKTMLNIFSGRITKISSFPVKAEGQRKRIFDDNCF